jgi:hypothetical protein
LALRGAGTFFGIRLPQITAVFKRAGLYGTLMGELVLLGTAGEAIRHGTKGAAVRHGTKGVAARHGTKGAAVRH